MTYLRLLRAVAAVCVAITFTTAGHPADPPPATAQMYRTWLEAEPGREASVRGFETYLERQNVAGVFPIHEILRSESLWKDCGGEPFVLAPSAEWAHVVGTLRFIRDHVTPLVGQLEIVSGYRDPALNTCSGGALASSHVAFWALDLKPVSAIGPDEVIARLCPVHAAHGPAGRIGLGFYDGERFHIDSKSFRTWGADAHRSSSPCKDVVQVSTLRSTLPRNSRPDLQSVRPSSTVR